MTSIVLYTTKIKNSLNNFMFFTLMVCTVKKLSIYHCHCSLFIYLIFQSVYFVEYSNTVRLIPCKYLHCEKKFPNMASMLGDFV